MTTLRFLTYLTPSLPNALFELIARYVEQQLKTTVILNFEKQVSGPRRGEDPFSDNEVDVGFLCAPTVRWLFEKQPPSIDLLAAPVFADPRAKGCPVYFSDLIVPKHSSLKSLQDLTDACWAFNDKCSLSGWFNLLDLLADHDLTEDFLGSTVHSGSHLRSIDLVAKQEVDAAMIDSNVLRLCLAKRPELRECIRVLKTRGPCPIQPVVVRAGLTGELRRKLTTCLLAIGNDTETRRSMAKFELIKFVPVSKKDYGLV